MRLLANLYPKRARGKIKSLMKYSDTEGSPEQYVEKVVRNGILAAIVITILSYFLFSHDATKLFGIFIAVFLLAQITGYVSLMLKADAKGRVVEDVLPDALLLMSMNIKSGMTTDHALIMAARPEFGPLEKELNRAGKLIVGGREIRDALLDMTTRIHSDLFERTIRLILEGIESGGELSSLLQQTAEDIQNMKLVQNEVRSNLAMYAIFIFFAVGFGAPLLFGISTYLVGSVGTQFSSFQAVGSQQGFAGLQISTEFLVTFSILALTISSFFGGLIIGIIKSGSEKAGIKFIPILLVLSMTIFFLVRAGVAAIFPAI